MGKEMKLEIERFRGESAYEVAVRNGFEGTEAEWLASLHASSGTVNGIEPDASGNIAVKASDIPLGANDATTVAGKLTALETATSGKVATVNGKSPTNGAVTLGAADIKASDGETVQAKLTALEARPQGGATEYTGSLTVAGWTGSDAPYTQSVTVTGLAADAHLIVGIAPSATAEQVEAAANAMLLATAQAAGSITISAFGDKPDAAIPILIMEVG